MHNIPADGVRHFSSLFIYFYISYSSNFQKMPERIESELGRLLYERSLELRPVKVLLARKEYIQNAKAKAAQRQWQQQQPLPTHVHTVNYPQIEAPQESKEDDE